MIDPLLVRGRDSLTPYLYPRAMEFYERQTQARWEANDVSFARDVIEWANLDEDIKKVIAGVLRGFVQTELVVNEYWSTNVGVWFPHPEIKIMSTRFGDMEGVHALSYNQLSVSLGLDSYSAFKADPIASEKISFLLDTASGTLAEKARSLAIFSGMTEGVILFSSFAILQWLKTKSILPGVTTVIEYSIKDELLHSEAGGWLFRTLLGEAPELNTPKLWEEIEQGALAAIDLEHSFIDSVFKSATLDSLNPYDLKQFIIFVAQKKLLELGSNLVIPYDAEAANRISSWFDMYNTVQPITDSFARHSTNYTKGAFKINSKSLSFA
jgi:ribonucleoside-diphosphate reductase beta chain